MKKLDPDLPLSVAMGKRGGLLPGINLPDGTGTSIATLPIGSWISVDAVGRTCLAVIVSIFQTLIVGLASSDWHLTGLYKG